MLETVATLLRSFFASPQWLWLLTALPVLAVVDALRGWGTAGVGRRIGAGLLRALMFTALVAALADPRWHKRQDVAHVIMVVDRSASIPDRALTSAIERATALKDAAGQQVRVGLVLFDDEPEVAVFPGRAWDVPDPVRDTIVEISDIDEALQLALGLIPADEAGEIVLFTDGRPTAGGLATQSSAVASAEAHGVKVHTVVLAPERDDAAVTAVVLAERDARPGATVEGHVELDGSDKATKGTVQVKIGDKVVASTAVDLAAGETVEVPFSHQLDARTEPGTAEVTADFIPDDAGADGNLDNNHGLATLIVGNPPKVRIVAGEEHDAKSMARALRAERMDVEVVLVGDLAPQHNDLSEVDLVVLANAPALPVPGGGSMSEAFVASLARWVDAGGGLVVLGGPMSYDMGGYNTSELARVLPVRLDQVDPEVESAATIIIVLDKSGSMAAFAGLSKTKMQLANEGAVASIRLLRSFDKVAVMSVTETVHWEVPLQPVHNPAALERKVLSIRSEGGGIYVYTAIEAARAQMKKTDTPLRHVILFSDAADSEEKVKGVAFGTGPGHSTQQLAREMRGDGITTSVIGIGTEDDSDTEFLKEVAEAGGGRFYLTADAAKLRGLFVEETERLVDSSLHEAKFRPLVKVAHPATSGVDYSAGPQLRGYQELAARPTAEVLLTGPNDDPILTTWRYGLGQVAAWSSDAGPRWSEDWLPWEGYGQQWTQIARWALRSRAGDETALEVDFQGGRGQLRVVRRGDDGLTLDEGGLRARVTGGEDTSEVS
ncbi:MAG: VWA domain-containing protein, partial [Myxococcota bacterium]